MNALGVPEEPGLALLETELLLQGIRHAWGVDFRGYDRGRAAAILRRRARVEGCASLSELQARALRDVLCVRRIASDLHGPAPRAFERPAELRWFRDRVLPWLRTYASVRVWVPACGRGALAYSLATLLLEGGLGRRLRVYGTDADRLSVEAAKEGPLETDGARVREAWRRAGGGGRLDRWWKRTGTGWRPGLELRSRMTFDVHSFETDDSFNEFHVIVCRGVLGRLEPAPFRRAVDVLDRSLATYGFLGLDAAPFPDGCRLPEGYRRIRRAPPYYWRCG